MGRFDALTKLEEPKKTSAPSPVFSPPTYNQQTKTVNDQTNEAKKPAKPQTRLPSNKSSALDSLEKPEKYTTRLEPSLVRKIRIFAAEKEIKDYEVVKNALKLYFEKTK